MGEPPVGLWDVTMLVRRLASACRMLLLAGVLGASAGCASSKLDNVFIPLEDSVALASGASQVEMLVATTRKPSDVPGAMYGGDRGAASFAEITISVPPGHKPGAVEWPTKLPADPQKSFATVKAEFMDRDQIIALFNKRLAKEPSHSVLVFVHGYNNRFDDAVFRFAQIVHDSGTRAVPVLFTWPSRGGILAYGYDKDSATYSRDALERLLGYLVADKSVNEISIMAHSMGNWVTLETLRQMSIRNQGLSRKIRNVLLADPDVDIDIFQTQVVEMGEKRPDLTVFISDDDKALAASKIIWGSTARLGDIDPANAQYMDFMRAHRIHVVNMTAIKTEDGMNHGKFAESPEVIRLIGQQLASGQPISERQINPNESVSLLTASVVSAGGALTGK